jgi:hypothetical protein
MVNKMLEGEADHYFENELERGKKNRRNDYTKKQLLHLLHHQCLKLSNIIKVESRTHLNKRGDTEKPYE